MKNKNKKKNQFCKMIKNSFYLIFFYLLPFYGLAQSGKYVSAYFHPNEKSLILLPESTYKYDWYRFYGVGLIDDTVSNSGKWKNVGDTLFLNSFIKPDNYNLYIVKELIDKKSDSLTIILRTDENIPFFMISPTAIRINNFYYQTPRNIISEAKFVLNKSTINFIILAGAGNHYPIYYPKNSKSNYFEFIIKEIKDKKDKYPPNSYFIDEKFLIKGDSLFHLRNNEINRNEVFIKEK